MVPEDFEQQLGKFKAKGLICFEEITDYSLITNEKVNFETFFLKFFCKQFISKFLNFS